MSPSTSIMTQPHSAHHPTEGTSPASRPVAQSDEDRELVARVVKGDASAFGRLVEMHMRRAYRVALGLVGSTEDAMDLSQEAFVRAFKARDTLDPERPFYPWYHQILRRLCFNFLRDRKTRRTKLEGMTPWLVADAGHRAASRDPASETRLSELRDRLAEAIEELPDSEREVFVLREFEDLRYREIAEVLAIPQGTVMSRLYNARRRLADRLEDQR